jgi:hypothetical protein
MLCFWLYKAFHPDAHGARIRGLLSDIDHSANQDTESWVNQHTESAARSYVLELKNRTKINKISCTSSDRLLHQHTWLSIDQISATTQTTLALTLLMPWLVEVVVVSNPVAFGGQGIP